MSIFDGKRLTNDTFKLDVARMRCGWYSDKYFLNVTRTLAALAAAGYRFGGDVARLSEQSWDLPQDWRSRAAQYCQTMPPQPDG